MTNRQQRNITPELRFAYDRRGGVFRAWKGDAIVPICEHCDKRGGCDFKRDDLKGCDSFSKITSGRQVMTPAPTTTAWAIKAPDGTLYVWTQGGLHRLAQSETKPTLLALQEVDGYRCVRVQVQEIPHD